MWIRLFSLVLIATILMGAKACDKRGKTIYISDSCEVALELFYPEPDRKFTFTEDEVDHLRPVNQTKISNFKAWFQAQCPAQYAVTAGGKAKKVQ